MRGNSLGVPFVRVPSIHDRCEIANWDKPMWHALFMDVHRFFIFHFSCRKQRKKPHQDRTWMKGKYNEQNLWDLRLYEYFKSACRVCQFHAGKRDDPGDEAVFVWIGAQETSQGYHSGQEDAGSGRRSAHTVHGRVEELIQKAVKEICCIRKIWRR